ACPQSDRNGRVEMTPRYMADGEGHGEHRQAEGQRDAREADPQGREGRRQHRTATTPEYQPEGTDELSRDAPAHLHGHCLLIALAPNLRMACRSVHLPTTGAGDAARHRVACSARSDVVRGDQACSARSGAGGRSFIRAFDLPDGVAGDVELEA